jgi:hypothetical protein
MHNLENPPRLNVDISRELPFPVVAAIMGQAITALGQAAWERMTKPLTPRITPEATPASIPKQNGK